MCEQFEWDDPLLAVSSDSLFVRRYRRLQSWHRQHVLRAHHGWLQRADRSHPVGSLLAVHEVDSRPELNFLQDVAIFDWVDEQVRRARSRRATLSGPRLRMNMLSSMPMAFTLGAMLSAAPDRVDIVRAAFDLELDEVTEVVPEWAPFPDHPLGDKTAFDLAIFFEHRGRKGVLGIETKYTDSFSPKPYDTQRYREVTGLATPAYFVSEAADRLVGPATNQLWRQRMLSAAIVESDAPEVADVEIAEVAAVGLAADPTLWTALKTVQSQCGDTHPFTGVSWEQLVELMASSTCSDRALRFRSRYLDLDQIEA